MTVATQDTTRQAPIGPEQRATIIARMKRTGKWTGRKRGRRVRLWLKPTPNGTRIGYQVHLGWSTVCHGTAFSVAAAVEACNEVLTRSTADSPLPPGKPAHPRPAPSSVKPYQQLQLREPERLPYKDSE